MSQVLAEPQVSQTYFTLRLSPAIEMTDDEFFALCQLNRDLRFERTAEGDIDSRVSSAPSRCRPGQRRELAADPELPGFVLDLREIWEPNV